MTETLLKQLSTERDLPDDGLKTLLEGSAAGDERLFAEADRVRRMHYGTDVYIRGLIEWTNYCVNDCYYCGIRRSNRQAKRYRLGLDDILECCRNGYALGFRTFVLQGGEDARCTDAVICETVSAIKTRHPDCAVTLSLGEKSCESYKAYFNAGADRYLLRHETADEAHYGQLHPEGMRLTERMRCLWDLKAIGYQTGAGMMVGSPGQTIECIIADLRFLQQLKPDMVGVGPFLAHAHTPFRHQPNGSLALSLRVLALVRLMLPHALIPATTALGTLDPRGREQGLKAGANVVMPNLSPVKGRKLYALYNNKIHTGEEAAEGLAKLTRQVEAAGYRIVTDIGHVKRF